MKIRPATRYDIDRLVAIDRIAYGKHGANNQYFQNKFQAFPQGILVVEKNGLVTGFTVIELLNAGQTPKDFTDFKPAEPLVGVWMHIIAFTTATNYQDVKADSELVAAAEKIGKQYGAVAVGVPLSKDHPYAKNGVFDFWQSNGYKLAGEINWVASPDKKIECYFYKKDIN